MGAFVDLAGKTFGRLTAIETVSGRAMGSKRWRCRCECGREAVVISYNLRSGNSTSCGCQHRATPPLDLAGRRFGRLVAVERSGHSAARKVKWRCQCDCGAEIAVIASRLVAGGSRSCGCLKSEETSARQVIDVAGERFGRLIALSFMPCGARPKWLCRCDCGREVAVNGASMRAGLTRSCGCLKHEDLAARSTTHGATVGKRKSPEYGAWSAMRRRCMDPKSSSFANYGGRGISVCPQWDDFAIFLRDMGSRPLGRTLDRIDNDGDYEPGNCRWLTQRQQCRNTRYNHRITARGETLTLVEWSERSGLRGSTIANRLTRGWSPDRAVSEPSRLAH